MSATVSESLQATAGQSTPSTCLHCGTACAPSESYCCGGCAAAASILGEGGWAKFYALRGARGPTGEMVDAGEATPAWLQFALERVDSSTSSTTAATDSVAPSHGESLSTLRCRVSGLHCAACSWLIPEIAKAAGARAAQVNAGRGTLEVHFRGPDFHADKLVTQLKTLGYELHPEDQPLPSRSSNLLLRTGLTLALAMNTMLLSLARYLGLSEVDGVLFVAIEAVLMVLAVVVGGSYFFRRAYEALRHGALSLDVPIALGIVLSATGSFAAYLAKLPATYFDTVTVFIAFMLIGRAFQAFTAERAQAKVRAPTGGEQWRVRRVRPAIDDDNAETLEFIEAGALEVGDHVRLAPGDLVMTSARTLDRGSFSFEWLTGEPEPRDVAAGAALDVGSRYRGSSMTTVEVTAPFDFARVSALLAPRHADDVVHGTEWLQLTTRVYPFAVIALAAIGFGLWASYDVIRAVEVMISLLVITCPCALGLAIPLAYELAIARAHTEGVLVCRPSVFDRLPHVDVVAFDKTGTLSLGDLKVANKGALSALSAAEKAALLALATASNHPRSRAVASALLQESLPPIVVDALDDVPGCGVQGRVTTSEGVLWVRFGAPSWVSGSETAHLDDTAGASVFASSPAISGPFVDIAMLRFDEHVRPRAVTEIESLLGSQVVPMILSGDLTERVQAFARRLGMNAAAAHGSMTPASKEALIDDLTQQGHHVLMVGDGLNDAGALDAAFVRAAPAVDVPGAVRACDVVALGRDIVPVHALMGIAARVRSVVRANVVFAVVFNLIASACALSGIVTPLFAAIWMPAGSLIVVVATVVAFRIRRPRSRSPRAPHEHLPHALPAS